MIAGARATQPRSLATVVFLTQAALELGDQRARLVAFRDRPAAVAPLDRRLEAVGLRLAPKPQALGVVARDAVEHRRERLRLLEAGRRA